MTDIECLLNELNQISNYPFSKMEEVKIGIKGVAFFPGGRGLYNDDDQTVSDKDIMILGQDFDTKKKYKLAEQEGKENLEKNKTWKNLKSFLQHAEVNIDVENCFFTNALMGIRLTDNASGRSPGFDDEEFVKTCQKFFLFQVQLQKPKVIIVMGLQVAKFLAPLSNGLSRWKSAKGFKEIDEVPGNAIIKGVEFDTIESEVRTNLILLMHPSARAYNLNSRNYKGKIGNAAQIEMFKEVLVA